MLSTKQPAPKTTATDPTPIIIALPSGALGILRDDDKIDSIMLRCPSAPAHIHKWNQRVIDEGLKGMVALGIPLPDVIAGIRQMIARGYRMVQVLPIAQAILEKQGVDRAMREIKVAVCDKVPEPIPFAPDLKASLIPSRVTPLTLPGTKEPLPVILIAYRDKKTWIVCPVANGGKPDRISDKQFKVIREVAQHEDHLCALDSPERNRQLLLRVREKLAAFNIAAELSTKRKKHILRCTSHFRLEIGHGSLDPDRELRQLLAERDPFALG